MCSCKYSIVRTGVGFEPTECVHSLEAVARTEVRGLMFSLLTSVNHMSAAVSHESFSWGCWSMGPVGPVFRPECTGRGLRPELRTPHTQLLSHMQLAFPPLRATNQRSVHVKTDGSQIKLFWGFLSLSVFLSFFFFFPLRPQPPVIFPLGVLWLWTCSSFRSQPLHLHFTVNHVIFCATTQFALSARLAFSLLAQPGSPYGTSFRLPKSP